MSASSADQGTPLQGQEAVDEPTRRLLVVLATLEVRRRGTAEAIADALGDVGSIDTLRGVPDVEIGGERVTVGGRWLDVEADAGAVASTLELAARAAAQESRDAGDLSEAGRYAAAGSSAEAMREVLRDALSTQPPKVSAHDLRSWRDVAVLQDDDPHAWWLDAACRSLLEGPSPAVFDRYEQAVAAFAARGDAAAELAVGMAAAVVARRLDDLGAIARFIGRANELVEAGHQPASASAQLGEALVHQMLGDPSAALAVLDGVAPDAFEGDWAAQVAMMRGTNLMLLDRVDDAVACLSGATGTGGGWSHSVALELLALARWLLDDRVGAVRDLEVAEELALQAGSVLDAGRMQAQRAAMLAADGDPAAAPLVSAALAEPRRDDETDRILAIAGVLIAVADDDPEGAAEAAARLDAPERAVRSTHWTVALQCALAPASAERWTEVVANHPALAPALRAGRDGAAHLAGGPLVDRRARPYLPTRWCEPVPPVVEIRLLGGASVRTDRQVVRAKAWERGRVRELCCYLALVADSSRDLAAERLWPDLSGDAAAKNLRVTLSYLLDVLDPDRARGVGSDLVSEVDGTLAFAHTERLRIDVRELLAHSRGVLAATTAGDERALVREARLLARVPRGALLGGAALGSWVEPYEQARRELVLRAVSAGGPVVLRIGDADLAEALARRGLDEDPWAERLHQLVVRACLARDDLDAARRALRQAFAVIAELDVRPERATLDLARQVGISPG
jgi:DNA-binding SARP family transcriptional activator